MTTETMSAEERSNLEAELREITTKKQGQDLNDVRRVAEIKQALSENGEEPAAKKQERAEPRRSTKYPDQIHAAVDRTKDAFPAAAASGYPGPKQHALVRKVVGKQIEGNPTPEKISKLAGVSQKTLVALADRSAPRGDLKPLRELSSKMNDGWAKGRDLAMILSVWVDQLKAEKRRKK